MLVTKEQQEIILQKYQKDHTIEECVGFIDGINETIELMSRILNINNDSLPELKSNDKPMFIKKYKGLASDTFLTKVWEFGNNRWTDGYNQGKYNPEFEQTN